MSDLAKGEVWRSLLQERLARFPRDDVQVVATKLGNGIRRLEEFGYHRYGLDSQILWNELNAAAPEPARKQAEDSRIPVDFFVALLWGHVFFAVAAVVTLASRGTDHPRNLVLAVPITLAMAVVWYHVAVVTTDEWAASVRGLVNLGRKPLAEGMGYALPTNSASERSMWLAVAQLSGGVGSGADTASRLDAYRQLPPLKSVVPRSCRRRHELT